MIALFVGSFVIFNTFSITVAQRVRELALLRAVGASRRQVMASVLGESLVIGLVASAAGVVAGIGLSLNALPQVGATAGIRSGVVKIYGKVTSVDASDPVKADALFNIGVTRAGWRT